MDMEKVQVFYKQFSIARIFREDPNLFWKRVAFHGNICKPFLLSKGCDGFRYRGSKSSLIFFKTNHAPTEISFLFFPRAFYDFTGNMFSRAFHR